MWDREQKKRREREFRDWRQVEEGPYLLHISIIIMISPTQPTHSVGHVGQHIITQASPVCRSHQRIVPTGEMKRGTMCMRIY